MSTYVFNQAWQNERDRLHALESLFDDSSRRLVAGLGVREGWRCLEVGCGAGGMALWLADQVGGTGRVLATDLDPRFLEGHGRANLDVLTHDILTDPLDDASFDLAHTRAVLAHIPASQDALARMIAAVKPGGWLLVEDVQLGKASATALAEFVFTSHPAAADAMGRIFQAISAVLDAVGADTSFAARLPATLAGAGLVNVGAEVHTRVVSGGTENWTRQSAEQLRERLIGTGLVSLADIELYLTATADPSTYYTPPLMVSAWGQRPVS